VRHLACALVAACGPPHDLPDAPPCAPPSLAQTWLPGMVADVIGRLAQAPRYTTAERATAASYLEGELTQLGWQPQVQAYATGTDVYAVIPGATAQQIVIGAHYDTVMDSPGGDDNASGVATVLAVARLLRQAPCRDPSVTVALFDQEEEGELGSRAFAAMLAGSDVLAVHTVDQVGWDADGDHRFELELPTAALAQEYAAAAAIVGVPLTSTTTANSDHQSFRDAGFAAVGLTEEFVEGDTTPYRHTPQDTAATVDTPYAVLAAQLLAQVVLAETIVATPGS